MLVERRWTGVTACYPGRRPRRNRSSAVLSGPAGRSRASADSGRSDALSSGFASGFRLLRRIDPNLHAHADSSKFPPIALQGGQEVGVALPHDGGDRAGVDGKFQLPVSASATRIRGARGRGRSRRTTPVSASSPPRRASQAARVGSAVTMRLKGCGERAMAERATGLRPGGGPTRWGWIGRSPFEHHSGLERHGARANAHAGLAPLDDRQASGSRSSSSPSPASSISSRCGTPRRSSIRGSRRSCSPISGRKR